MRGARSSPTPALVYRFGPYEADISRDQLRKFGIRVHLERKPWRLLVCLLQRAGEPVGRSELQRELWPDGTYVDFEPGLNVAITKVRAALADSTEEPKYIETIPGFGYRFMAPVTIGDRDGEPPTGDQPATTVPEGLPPLVVSGSARQSWWWKQKLPIAVAAAVCVAFVTATVVRPVWKRWQQGDVSHAGKVMLVVLPLENLSGDSSQEYLSDGMTEELSAQLGNLDPRQLGVIGRTSAVAYKHSHRSIKEIGKELGVDYVLEGSVRRNGSDVRVTAQLVQVSEQAHVWAASYDENLRDLLQLERDLAKEIARHVGVSIAIGTAKKPSQPHIPVPEAHEAYLLGRYSWYQRTTAGWKTSEDYFRLAIQKDPEYAAPYAALAECRVPKREALAAALKAIALDPTSGEAYTALGWVQMYRYLDLAEAETAFQRAIELAPNYPQAHYSHADALEMAGHSYESINEVKQAILLDPLSPLFHSGLAGVLRAGGQLDEAEKESKSVLEMNPRFAVAHGALGMIYIEQGKYKEAIEEFQTEQRLDGNPNLGPIGYAYACAGNRRQALSVRAQLHELEKNVGGVAADLVIVELGLGNEEEAITWLQKLYDEHEDEALLGLQVEHVYDPLRADPKFQDIVRRMNFPK